MSKTTKVTLKDGAEYPTIKAFCDEHDLNYQLTVGRLNNDWTPEECIDPTLKTDYRKHKADYSKTPRYSTEALEKKRIGNHARWIRRATKKHGEKFCYKNTLPNFKTAKMPEVKIECLEHSHPFHIIPDKHAMLKNGGCKFCWKEQVAKDSLEKEEPKFLAWFNDNLSERLELRSKFQGWNKPLHLYCKIHKKSHKTSNPQNLKYGGALGCGTCSDEALKKAIRLDLKSVLEKVKVARELPKNITLIDVIFDEEAEGSRIRYSCALDSHGIRPKMVDLAHLKQSPLICDLCTSASGGTAEARYRRLIKRSEEGDLAVIGVMEIQAFGATGMKIGVTTRTLQERYGYSLKTIFFSLEMKELYIYFIENRVKRRFANFRDNIILGKGLRSGKRWSGDTEIFQRDKQQEIINYIVELSKSIELGIINKGEFKTEVDHFISMDFEPRDVGKEKDTSNEPIPIIGIDVKTHEIKFQLDSISEAQALGFRNVSTIINNKGGRQISKGIRWCKASEFDQDNIPPMRERKIHNERRVRCIETGKIFRTTELAEKAMRSPKHPVQASKISSVCRGKRKRAGGYSWEYVDPKEET